MSRRDPFLTVRTEGGLLPADLLQRLTERPTQGGASAGPKPLEGLTPDAYHLPSEKLSEVISASYARLRNAWTGFRAAWAALPPGDPATTITRERWLLPLFRELDFGRLPARKPLVIAGDAEGKGYPISHGWEDRIPIHLVGAGVALDRSQKPGKASKGQSGAARQSPHGLLQELLNRSPAHLWGFVSNGLILRVLRDNLSLTRQAYVEFDLQALMDGQVYPDFILLWLLCHQSRVEAERPSECWLERWSQQARAQGTRALDKLRGGVEAAIKALGEGFLQHPRGLPLRDLVRSGALTPRDYYRQLLRLVYQLLFLLVAEARGVLLDPGADAATRARYADHYSLARLRRLAERRAGSAHCDLWRQLRLLIDALGQPEGCPALGLPGLGGSLFAAQATPALLGRDLSNQALLDALRALCFTTEGKVRRAVSYANLGAEELGSVYEALLELHLQINADQGTVELVTAPGHERKTTGSYYTPTSLVTCLLDSALDPLLRAARGEPQPEEALLRLKVVDPACGSGHFLVAAAHRIARQVAAVRTGEEEPPIDAVRAALHDVIARCLYGVDSNEMAVELCKVSLWMEAMEPGKPLSFLDHHVRCGNSLLGATPALLRRGVPDEAFEALEGDDKKVCTALRKRNKKERENPTQQAWSFSAAGGALGEALRGVDEVAETGMKAVQEKEARYLRLRESPGLRRAKLLADAYCAAFVIRKDAATVKAGLELTYAAVQRMEGGPDLAPLPLREEIERLTQQYQFLHYHVEFPDVFQLAKEETSEGPGWTGGFDCVLGNPPWERVKLQEQEFFASRHPEIAKAANAAARKKLIAALPQTDPALWHDWCAASREAEGQSHFVRDSGRFPLCGKGDVNTYALFAENNWTCLSPQGRSGFIVPTGIVTDEGTSAFLRALVQQRGFREIISYENEGTTFGGVNNRQSFCLLSLSRVPGERTRLLFNVNQPLPENAGPLDFELAPQEFALFNPNSGNCPTFRTRRDAAINLTMYRKAGVLWNEADPGGNPWNIRFLAMFHMANDSGLFRFRKDLEPARYRMDGNRFVADAEAGAYLPLLEAKMMVAFDHRYGTYEGATEAHYNKGFLPHFTDADHADASRLALPDAWVAETEVEQVLRDRWSRGWLLGWRDICRRTDIRTVIPALVPRVAVGHTTPLMLTSAAPPSVAALYANLCSFALDYTARQKIGGTHLTYGYLKQLPVLPPATYEQPAPWAPEQSLVQWLLPRVLELTYTAWDLQPFARDCGYEGPPYRWDPERRFLLRAELDAAFFHLYGVSRDDAAYILDTFPIVRNKDEKAHGDYRTRRVILERYDALATAARGAPYVTPLDPPPADPRIAHPPRPPAPAPPL